MLVPSAFREWNNMVELKIFVAAAPGAGTPVSAPNERARVIRYALSTTLRCVDRAGLDLAKPLDPRILPPRAIPDEELDLIGTVAIRVPVEVPTHCPQRAARLLQDQDGSALLGTDVRERSPTNLDVPAATEHYPVLAEDPESGLLEMDAYCLAHGDLLHYRLRCADPHSQQGTRENDVLYAAAARALSARHRHAGYGFLRRFLNQLVNLIRHKGIGPPTAKAMVLAVIALRV